MGVFYRFCLVLVAITLCFAAPARANCIPDGDVPVEVVLHMPDLVVSNKKTFSQIGAMTTGTTMGETDYDSLKGQAGSGSFFIPAVTISEMHPSINADFGAQPAATGNQGCLYVKALKVTLIMPQSVYIANTYPEGSCDYDAMLEHEFLHVEANTRIFMNSRAHVSDYMQDALRKMHKSYSNRNYTVEQAAQIKTQIEDYLLQSLEVIAGDMKKFLLDENRAIDTAEEYKKVQLACKDMKKYQSLRRIMGR